MNRQRNRTIAVVGLGTMGRRLAELLKDHFDVIVWNRTSSKAKGLTGVQIAASAEAAFRQGDAVVMCVYDYAAVKEVVHSINDQTVFSGKTLINFTTDAPEEASEMESFISTHDGHYINGALQVAPDQMGLVDTTILVSGR